MKKLELSNSSFIVKLLVVLLFPISAPSNTKQDIANIKSTCELIFVIIGSIFAFIMTFWFTPVTGCIRWLEKKGKKGNLVSSSINVLMAGFCWIYLIYGLANFAYWVHHERKDIMTQNQTVSIVTFLCISVVAIIVLLVKLIIRFSGWLKNYQGNNKMLLIAQSIHNKTCLPITYKE